MSELERASSSGSLPAENLPRCRYCGSPLSAFYYFCLACGTPYKSVRSVVAAPLPPVLSDEDRVALRAPSAAPLFWSYFTVIVACAIITELAFSEDRPDLTVFVTDLAVFLTTCAFAAIHWRALAAQLKRTGLTQPAALIGFVALAGLLVVNYGYSWLLREAGARDGMPIQKLRESGMDEATIIALFCALPAINEEIAFRGLLQHWLQVALTPAKALVIASVLFAAMHFSVLSLPYLFAVGYLLGWVKWKTGSLYPSMLLHFIHNLIVIEFF